MLKREILSNGPVIVACNIQLDMLTYKSGIYEILESVPKFRGGT